MAHRCAPDTRLYGAERLVVVENEAATQPLYHDVRLRQNTTRHVAATPRPRVRRRLMTGCKLRSD